jgi:hypothetical protein
MLIHVDHMGVEVDRNILSILGNFVDGVASYGEAQEAQIWLVTCKNKGEGSKKAIEKSIKKAIERVARN